MTKATNNKISRVSNKASQFTESVIRDMTRQAIRHGAVNLAQGFPDFATPEDIKRAAQEAIESDINQYAITWGAKNLREAIAEHAARFQDLTIDPETEITVCCGSTEAMIASLLAIVDPGDEVVIFEPYYENYGPDAIISDAKPRFVRLDPPQHENGEWTFDRDRLRGAFNSRTKALIVNTPNNPTGKVFSRAELEYIRDLCVEFDVIAITDEIYEHIIYDGAKHISLATLEGMRDRTVTINGMSKTFSVTGWRVGWAMAPAMLTSAIRKVHDFLTVGAAAPLQAAGAMALRLPDNYFLALAAEYKTRRDLILPVLHEAGFKTYVPQGAYYVLTDIGHFGYADDVAFARFLVQEVGVAAVPGSSFYSNPKDGSQQVRFAFCKKEETLAEAGKRLAKLKPENRATSGVPGVSDAA
jgi:aspartate/methionine/tyrosine aminotransferase